MASMPPGRSARQITEALDRLSKRFERVQTPNEFIDACEQLNRIKSDYGSKIEKPKGGDDEIKENIFEMPKDALVDLLAQAMGLSASFIQLVIAILEAKYDDVYKTGFGWIKERIEAGDLQAVKRMLKDKLRRQPAVRRALQSCLVSAAKTTKAIFRLLDNPILQAAMLFVTPSRIGDEYVPYYALKQVEYMQDAAMRRAFGDVARPLISESVKLKPEGPTIHQR